MNDRKLAACFLLIAVTLLRAENIPNIESKTLAGAPLSLPKHGSVRPLLLVLGFSQKSGENVKTWNKPFQAAYEQGGIDYFELADLQGVPSFVMPMILHGMRRAIQEPERSHFAVLLSREEEWKKLVNYSDPNIAYIVLADGSGHVISQARGAADTTKVAQLQALMRTSKINGK